MTEEISGYSKTWRIDDYLSLLLIIMLTMSDLSAYRRVGRKVLVLRKKGTPKYDGARPVGVLDNRMRVLHLSVGCEESPGSGPVCGDPQDPDSRPTKGDMKNSSLDSVTDNISGTKVQPGPQTHKSVASLGHAH